MTSPSLPLHVARCVFWPPSNNQWSQMKNIWFEASLVCVTSTYSFFLRWTPCEVEGRCECESLANCQQASCQHFNSVFTPAISCWKLGLSTAEHLVDNDKLCHNASQWATTLNTSPPTTTRPLVWGLEFSNLDINVHNIQRRYLLY